MCQICSNHAWSYFKESYSSSDCLTDVIEFYMTVCPCKKHDAGHQSRHNSFAAVRIAELLSNAGFIDEDAKLNAVSCCSEKDMCDGAPSHTKHYVLVYVSEALLRHTVCVLNQGFYGVLADDKIAGGSLFFISNYKHQ